MPSSPVELLGACFLDLRCGKFHMALAWDRARPCLSGQRRVLCTYLKGGSRFPPPHVQVVSCSHFHPFNHRLGETVGNTIRMEVSS